MLQTKTLESLDEQQFQRVFNESRAALALRHRQMAEDAPHMVRRWQDGRFVLVTE